MIECALELLKQHWGHTSLRPAQAKVIEYATAGEDVIAVLPTGFGKSAMYQLPGLMFEGTVIVVSPLIALMKDQVGDCLARGIAASFINSHVTEKEAADRLTRLIYGEYKVFYIAPERIANAEFKAAIEKTNVSFVVIDEAHAQQWNSCVSTPDGYVNVSDIKVGMKVWGRDFSSGETVVNTVEIITSRQFNKGELVDIELSSSTVRVTCDHPIFILNLGYIPAGSVKEGDYVVGRKCLRGMSSEFYPQSKVRDTYAASLAHNAPRMFVQMPVDLPPLDNEVFELLKAIAERFELRLLLRSVWTCEASRWCVGAHEERQSNAVGEDTEKSLRRLKATWRSLCERKPWRQRKSPSTGAPNGLRLVSRIVGGTTCMYWEKEERTAVVRESGCGDTETPQDNRDRRELTPQPRSTGQRLEAGQKVYCSRVVRVSRPEQPCARKPDVCEGTDTQVYTLTVSGTHNYYADNTLVHNCSSTWGHDFRPAYLRIRDLTDNLNPRPPVMAFTATATTDVVKDIALAVGLREEHRRVVADPIRPNLNFQIRTGSPYAQLMSQVKKWDITCGRYVVYVGTRKMTEELAANITGAIGKKNCVGSYHGAMKKAERIDVQDRFKAGTAPVIIATNAFGMGIDVPDIRYVVHYGIPGSLENYVQESGRAGRDGMPSNCVLLCDPAAVRLQQNFINWGNPKYDVYVKLWAWLNANLNEDEILKMGSKKISEAVGNVNAGDIDSVLSTMSAYGLVERTPIPYGTNAHASLTALRGIAFGSVPVAQSVRKVAKASWDLYVMPAIASKQANNGIVEFGLDREALADTSGMSKSTVGKAIEEIEKKGGWETEALDYSKTTRLLMPGSDLNDVLPKSVVKAKLDRDQWRLDCMVEYTNLPNGQHVKYVRDYFLGAEGGDE